MDGAVPCPSPSGHDYLPDQPPVRHGTTATATCGYCGHTITATRPVPRRRTTAPLASSSRAREADEVGLERGREFRCPSARAQES
jgi:hypothetical protein